MSTLRNFIRLYAAIVAAVCRGAYTYYIGGQCKKISIQTSGSNNVPTAYGLIYTACDYLKDLATLANCGSYVVSKWTPLHAAERRVLHKRVAEFEKQQPLITQRARAAHDGGHYFIDWPVSTGSIVNGVEQYGCPYCVETQGDPGKPKT